MRRVQARIRQIVRRHLGLSGLGLEVALKARLTEDLGADPSAVAQLLLAVEEAFDIDISSEAAERFRTPQDLIDHATALLAKQRPSLEGNSRFLAPRREDLR